MEGLQESMKEKVLLKIRSHAMKPGLLFLLLLIPSLALGGELCPQFNGKCRDVCAENEVAEEGAFMDCGEKQACCVPKRETQRPVIPEAPLPAKKEKEGPHNYEHK